MTTCGNFDGRPFGFRLLKVRPGGNYTWGFVPALATADAGQRRQWPARPVVLDGKLTAMPFSSIA